MDLFSIILTNYNQEEYIYNAIDSVLKQKYQNIELIITDDCSKIFNQKKIRDYINQNKKDNIKDVKFVINEINIGTVKTLNKAIKEASGEYILFFAADDVLYNELVIDNFVKEFINNQDYNIITMQALMCNEDLKEDNNEKFVDAQQMLEFNKYNALEQFYYIANECPFVSGATAYRKDIFRKNIYIDEDFILVEDWSFWLKLTSLNEKIKYVDNITLLHRNGGVSHSEFKRIPPKVETYYKDIIKVYTKYIIPSLKKVPKKYKYSIINKYMFYICYYDKYIPGIYNDNLDDTHLAWKYTHYKRYFRRMQRKKRRSKND